MTAYDLAFLRAAVHKNFDGSGYAGHRLAPGPDRLSGFRPTRGVHVLISPRAGVNETSAVSPSHDFLLLIGERLNAEPGVVPRLGGSSTTTRFRESTGSISSATSPPYAGARPTQACQRSIPTQPILRDLPRLGSTRSSRAWRSQAASRGRT